DSVNSVGQGVENMTRVLDIKDVTGKAALHHACADVEERLSVVTSLLQAKAQVNIRDAQGNSPLHIACRYVKLAPFSSE
ncbi:unnamed protein product, partial [Chrysoparadoxa australica]